MTIFESSQKVSRTYKNGVAVAIGNYDGVHRGHQFILKQLKEKAKSLKLPVILYTFTPHPVKLFSPQNAPQLIQTRTQKIEMLADMGIDGVVFEKFTKTFAQKSPQNFFDEILVKNLNARLIAVGYDFTFGKNRSGNIEQLELMSVQRQINVMIIKPQMVGNTLVSSTLVRKQITDGHIENANKLLGRPHQLTGFVINGDSRGTLIGYPTANLKPENELIPKNGVYATTILINKRIFKSVTNIGVHPTFGGNKIKIETHILNFKRQISGKKISLNFIARLRDEIKFSNVDQLVKQINKDVIRAKRILK